MKNYRIMKRWHRGMEQVVYSVQKRCFGLFWKELDWFGNLGKATAMLENVIPTEIKVIEE